MAYRDKENAVFVPIYHVKAVRDDISSKTIRYDCVTLYMKYEMKFIYNKNLFFLSQTTNII